MAANDNYPNPPRIGISRLGKSTLIHPSERFPGHSYVFTVGKTVGGEKILWRCCGCNKLKRLGQRGKIPYIPTVDGRLQANPEFPKNPHMCQPKPNAEVEATQIVRETVADVVQSGVRPKRAYEQMLATAENLFAGDLLLSEAVKDQIRFKRVKSSLHRSIQKKLATQTDVNGNIPVENPTVPATRKSVPAEQNRVRIQRQSDVVDNTNAQVNVAAGPIAPPSTSIIAASPVTRIDVSTIEESSGAEDSSSEEVSNGVDNHSAPQVCRPSLPAVVNFVDGDAAEISTQNNSSPNASGAAVSTSGETQPVTSKVNGIDQNVVNSNEDQTEVPQLNFETLRLIMVETENELAKTQAELKTSQLAAENLWLASTLYENQLQQAKSEAEAKSTQLQLKCDQLEAQCKALFKAEQLEVERKSHQITVKSHQKENTNLCEEKADLLMKLIEFQNRSQLQNTSDQNSMDNRDQLKLKNRLTQRYFEEKSREEGNAQSPTKAVLIPPSERKQLRIPLDPADIPPPTIVVTKKIETTEDRQPTPVSQNDAVEDSIADELDYNSLNAQMLDPVGKGQNPTDIPSTSGTSNCCQTGPAFKKIRITRVIIDSDGSSDDEPVKSTPHKTLPPIGEFAGYKELASLTQSDSNVPNCLGTDQVATANQPKGTESESANETNLTQSKEIQCESNILSGKPQVPLSDPAKVTVATESPKTSSLKTKVAAIIPTASHSLTKHPLTGVNSIKKIVGMPSSTKAIYPMKLGGKLPSTPVATQPIVKGSQVAMERKSLKL